MGNDMAGVLKKLGYDKVDVLGYSMGGGGAFSFAAQHPKWFAAWRWFPRPIRRTDSIRDAAAAGGSRRRHAGADEGNADVQVVRGDRAHPEEFPKLLDAMAHTCASRTTGRRTSRN